MIQPCFSKAALIHERKDIWNTFCGPLPALAGSIAAQRQCADPIVDVCGTPADAACADVDRMWKPAFLDAPPDGRAATDASEVHDLLARQQFIRGHCDLRGEQEVSQDPDCPVAEGAFRSAGLRKAKSPESPIAGRYRVAPNPVTSERLDTVHRGCKEQKKNEFRSTVRLMPCENARVRPGLKEKSSCCSAMARRVGTGARCDPGFGSGLLDFARIRA